VDALEGTLAGARPDRAAAAAAGQLGRFAGEVELPFRIARDVLGVTAGTVRWFYPPAPAPADGDADLFAAVMRRESAFRAPVRSTAGAVGLMQLLPRTARRLAVLLGVEPDAAHLQRPEVNMALGARYLALLEDRFGAPAGAAAAYNAGPGVAASWARSGAGQPLDAWVEAIPYRETRRYVKTVLAARATYRWLRGATPDLDPASAVPPPAPGLAF
jgi:soluble lytic murein transglycosylase